MATAEEILAQVAGYGEQIIEAQRRLVAVPALGPTSGGQGELAKSELVQGWLEGLGLKVERVDAPDARVESGLRPNLVGTLAGGGGRKLWVLSHLDVVPVGDPALWSGDPWSLRVAGERLYARGVNDNGHGLVASFFGVKALVELGVVPPGQVGLILVSDEETGSLYGLDHVLKTRPELFGPDDLIVVPDVGEPDGGLIEVAEKSIFWLRAEVRGRQVHASTPHRGVNALTAAARMMVAVREIKARFPERDELFTLPVTSMEPTRHDVGVENINTIPGREVFYVDCRVLPTIELARVEAAFAEVFGEIARQEGVELELSVVQGLQAPPATPADAPVVMALKAAIARVHGVQARPGGVGGGTVAAFFRRRGLPVAVWYTDNQTAHQPDEWTSLKDLIKDAQVFALLASGLQGD